MKSELLFCTQLVLTWKMNPNEYKHAYVCSSASWDSGCYLQNQIYFSSTHVVKGEKRFNITE